MATGNMHEKFGENLKSAVLKLFASSALTLAGH